MQKQFKKPFPMGRTSYPTSDTELETWVEETVKREIVRGRFLQDHKCLLSERANNNAVFIKPPRLAGESTNRRSSIPKWSGKRLRSKSPFARNARMSTSESRDSREESYCSYRSPVRLGRPACSMRISELAAPTKRQCISAWRANAKVLPATMVDRLKQRVMDQEPIVKVSDAVNCMKNKKLPPDTRHNVEITPTKRPSRKINKDAMQSRIQAEYKILSDVFGMKIAQLLMKPIAITLNSQFQNLSNVISEEIRNVIKDTKMFKTDKATNMRMVQEVSEKVTIWIAKILEDSTEKLLQEDLRARAIPAGQLITLIQIITYKSYKETDLEEQEGPVLDILDDMVDTILHKCVKTPSDLLTPEYLSISSGEVDKDGQLDTDQLTADDEALQDDVITAVEEANKDTILNDIMNQLNKVIDSIEHKDTTKTPIKSDLGPEPNTQPEPDMKAEFDIKHEPDTEMKMNPELDIKAESDIHLEPDVKAGSNISPDPDIKAESDIKAGSDISTDPDIKAESNIKAGTDISPDPDIKAESDIKAGTDISPDSDIKAESDIQAGTDISPDPDIKAESDIKAGTDISPDPDIKAESDIKAGSDISPDPDIKAESDIKAGTDISPDPDIKAESDIKLKPDIEVLYSNHTGEYNDDEHNTNIHEGESHTLELNPMRQASAAEIAEILVVQNQDIGDENLEDNVLLEPEENNFIHTNEEQTSNVSGAIELISGELSEEKSKKVQFSNENLGPMNKKDHINPFIREILQFEDERLLESVTDFELPYIDFAPPNDDLLSHADESWPEKIPVTKPSTSVTRSITSMGKLLESDENNSAFEDRFIEHSPQTVLEQNHDDEEKDLHSTINPEVIGESEKNTNYDIQDMADLQNTTEELPHHIEIDETVLHGPLAGPETKDVISLLGLAKDASITSIRKDESVTLIGDEEMQDIEHIKEPEPIIEHSKRQKYEELHISKRDQSKSATHTKQGTTKDKIDQGHSSAEEFTSQKFDYRVHPKTAPAWIRRGQGEPNGSPCACKPLHYSGTNKMKERELEMRKWCRELDFILMNLNRWKNWLYYISKYITDLKRKAGKIGGGRHVRSPPSISEDTTWRTLNKRATGVLEMRRQDEMVKFMIPSAPMKCCVSCGRTKKNQMKKRHHRSHSRNNTEYLCKRHHKREI